MNRIYGKVSLKENRIGIPDLLIIIYDVDPNTKPEEIINTTDSTIDFLKKNQGFPGDRIGSVLTDKDGIFEFKYEDSEFQIRNPKEKRPDLFLMVMSPEEPNKNSSKGILYVPSSIRQNAGRSEQYLILFSEEQLKKAGIVIPTNSTKDFSDTNSIIHNMNLVNEQQEKIKLEAKNFAIKKVSKERVKSQQIKNELETRIISKLTNVNTTQADKLNYVLPGGNIEKSVWKTFDKNITGTINPMDFNSAYIVISNSIVENFKEPNGSFRKNIPADEITPFIYGSDNNKQRSSFLLREDPMALLCQSESFPKSLQGIPDLQDENLITESTQQPEVINPITGNSISKATSEDPPEYIARLMKNMTSPEETVAFGVRERANQDDLDNDLSTFELKSGPADVPAFYDFHNLQIAFDYVWQKAIDEDILEVSEKMFHHLIENGGDPLPNILSGMDPIKALREEFAVVNRVANSSNEIPNLLFMQNGGTKSGSGSGRPHLFDSFPKPEASKAYDSFRRRAHPLLDYLDELLNEQYSFTVFAPHSTNFGLLTTYRQKWDPINYQVGDLIKTIPLTPGEEQKITSKVIIKKNRNLKEMENSLRINKNDSSETSRAEAEIVRKAEAKTNFSLTSSGTYNIGISSGDATSVFGKDASTNSSETKKAFREAIIKASQEYKDERKLEVESKDSFLDEEMETTTIKNTNNELTVTYLFYELQRRFKVSEKIHRLTPVILVAMEVPTPSRKSMDSLLLTHGWIINRVLLDDSFRAPLNYLSNRMVGDDVALQEMKSSLDTIRLIVREMKDQLSAYHKEAKQRYTNLEEAVLKRINTTANEETEGWFSAAKDAVLGSGEEESEEGARLSEEAAQTAYEKAVQEEKQMRGRLDREMTAMNDATQAYSKKYAEHLNRKVEISRLRVHIKKNILYYMQAIWSSTFKDQLFFELHKIKVPILTSSDTTYNVSQPNFTPANIVVGPNQTILEVETNMSLDSVGNPEQDFKTLVEIADLDNPLGFKGNYMIFPLKESNPLTDFMMNPFIDSELGLHDPDDIGNWTPSEFTDYVNCLKENMDESQFKLIKGQLTEQYKKLISSPRRAEEEIIIPSGSLYIEALVGLNSLLEGFKLKHRAVDVKKVQAEVREMELENIRLAARLINNEFEDPDVEKTIVIKGGTDGVVVNP